MNCFEVPFVWKLVRDILFVLHVSSLSHVCEVFSSMFHDCICCPSSLPDVSWEVEECLFRPCEVLWDDDQLELVIRTDSVDPWGVSEFDCDHLSHWYP